MPYKSYPVPLLQIRGKSLLETKIQWLGIIVFCQGEWIKFKQRNEACSHIYDLNRMMTDIRNPKKNEIHLCSSVTIMLFVIT